MTTMAERRAAAAAKRIALTQKLAAAESKPTIQLPEGWVALGTCPVTGKPRYRTAPAKVEHIPTFAERATRWLAAKADQHVAGQGCPHCRGTGRYRFHSDASRNEKCYRCDGKGVLNAKDITLLNKRIGGAGPVCWVVTAAAA